MLQRAIELAPNNEAVFIRTRMEFDLKHYSAAARVISDALAERGDDSVLLTERGIAYAKDGRLSLAKDDFAAARSHATSARELNTMCWRMATEGVALDTALATCEDAVNGGPSVVNYLDSRGFVLLRLARYDEAIAAYDRALSISKTGAASLYGRGLAKRSKGDSHGGDLDIQSATVFDPDIAETFTRYGLAP
jgi:tetratricopeptide (TPR) repeat protein